jgi:hypothetical protein
LTTGEKKRLLEYHAQLESFQKDVAAFRDSDPVTQQYRKAFEEAIVPAVMEALPGAIEVYEQSQTQKPKDPRFGSNTAVLVEQMEQASMAPFGDVPKALLNRIQSGEIKIDNGKTTSDLVGMIRLRESTPSDFSFRNPFPKGSLEANGLDREYIGALLTSTAWLTQYIGYLPPNLAQRKRELEESYREGYQRVFEWREYADNYMDPELERARLFRMEIGTRINRPFMQDSAKEVKKILSAPARPGL